MKLKRTVEIARFEEGNGRPNSVKPDQPQLPVEHVARPNLQLQIVNPGREADDVASSEPEFGRPSPELRRLSDTATRIGRVLDPDSLVARTPRQNVASFFSDDQIGFAVPSTRVEDNYPLPPVALVKKVIQLRRSRGKYFDERLFADPAWDMLLDLLVARLESRNVPVSSLCIAAAVPPTTALRWIKALSDHDVIERKADECDGRRIFVRLSDKAMIGMLQYFDQLGEK
jgi:hypothetical protein